MTSPAITFQFKLMCLAALTTQNTAVSLALRYTRQHVRFSVPVLVLHQEIAKFLFSGAMLLREEGRIDFKALHGSAGFPLAVPGAANTRRAPCPVPMGPPIHKSLHPGRPSRARRALRPAPPSRVWAHLRPKHRHVHGGTYSHPGVGAKVWFSFLFPRASPLMAKHGSPTLPSFSHKHAHPHTLAPPTARTSLSLWLQLLSLSLSPLNLSLSLHSISPSSAALLYLIQNIMSTWAFAHVPVPVMAVLGQTKYICGVCAVVLLCCCAVVLCVLCCVLCAVLLTRTPSSFPPSSISFPLSSSLLLFRLLSGALMTLLFLHRTISITRYGRQRQRETTSPCCARCTSMQHHAFHTDHAYHLNGVP